MQGRALPELATRDARTATPERDAPARVPEPGRATSPLAAAQAELALAPQISIAGRPVSSGGSLTLPARELTRGPGDCQAIAETRVHNSGTAASGPFESTWQVRGMRVASGLFPGITPGGSDTQRAMLALQPGMNLLELAIDSSGRVTETNEGNNRHRFAVTVSGECGTAPALAPTAPSRLPVSPTLPPAPRPTTPVAPAGRETPPR
jgi:hypothetical protein